MEHLYIFAGLFCVLTLTINFITQNAEIEQKPMLEENQVNPLQLVNTEEQLTTENHLA